MTAFFFIASRLLIAFWHGHSFYDLTAFHMAKYHWKLNIRPDSQSMIFAIRRFQLPVIKIT